METLSNAELTLVRKSCGNAESRKRPRRYLFAFVGMCCCVALILIVSAVQLSQSKIDAHEFTQTAAFYGVLLLLFGTQWQHARFAATAVSTIAKLSGAAHESKSGIAMPSRE